MSGYIGNIPVPQATQTRDTFTATAGQTTFATSGYTPLFLDVFMNGVHLVNGTDYTATNGSDVVLTSGAAAGDVLEVVAYSTYQVNSQNYTGGLTVDNDGATVLTIDRATSDGTIIDLQKDGSSVGSIGVDSSTRLYFTNGTGAGLFLSDGTQVEPMNNGSRADATMSLGGSVYRFKDLYLSGGVYLGGTGAANYLDDYEEGSGTPTVNMSDGASITYDNANYEYTKVGNIVHFSFEFRITAAASSSGRLRVGLPFAIPTDVYSAGSARVYDQAFTGVPFLAIYSASTYVEFRTLVSNSPEGNIIPANKTQYYFGQITYRTS